MMAQQMTLPASDSSGAGTIITKVFERGILEKERNERYDVASETYDESVGASRYQGPISAAKTIASLYSPEKRSEVYIFDVGAGTGLAAEELQKLGFKTMDALDPSRGMLEKARKKGLYRNYYCEGITSEPLNIPNAFYDVITVVGSHGPNHIKGEAVHEMIRLVKSGGYVCIVTRRENFERIEDYKDTFFPMCDRLEKEERWRKVIKESCPFFPGVEGICLCYQIC